MKPSFRILTALAVLAVASICPAQGASGYPARPVRLVVPFAPGGTNDIAGRIVADKIAARLGQPFVIDNRGGANSIVGTDIAAKATPDGHTIVIVSAAFAVNPSLRKKLPYDSLRDFTPIGLVGGGPYLMVVHPSVPAKTATEFVAWAKSRAGQVNYASTGSGSPPHLAAELYKVMGKFEMTHVPYKGGGAVLPDLLAGRVSIFFGSITTLKPQVDAGKVRAVGVTTLKRSPAMPEVPTFVESGLPGYEVNGWYGLLAPGKTQRAIVGQLNRELQHALNDPDLRKRFAQRGMDPLPGTPETFAALIRSEIPKWAKVMKAAGIRPE
jgi:tripartite-type tricarboxylate transporter receptor subunit TctC